MRVLTNILRNGGFWITIVGVFAYCLIGFYWSVRFLAGNVLYTEWLILPMFAVIFGIMMLILSSVTGAFARNITFEDSKDQDFLCGTALLTTEILNSFADKMEEILYEADEPERSALMARILVEAERCELLDIRATNSIRTDRPFVFVMDLLRESPDAYEWMSALMMHGQQPIPGGIQDEIDLLAAIF
jgi:hypothetical protein